MFGSFPTSEVLLLVALGLLIIGIHRLFGRSAKAKAAHPNQPAKLGQSCQITSGSQESYQQATQDEQGADESNRASDVFSKTTVGVSFDLVNPKAVEWARQHAAENIAGLSSETKAAIRSLIVRAFTEGIPPRALAKEIRPLLAHTEDERRLIALHQNELQARKYKGLRLEKAIAKYAEKILATRASLIARTQIMRASNQGQLELWRQAVERGYLRGNERREWLGPRGPDSCEACRAMNGMKARLGEPFETPFGPLMGPPLHDECGCCMGLVE